MFAPRWTQPFFAFALALIGATAAGAPDAPPDAAPTLQLSDLPGMNFSQLSSSAQAELTHALNDEFCYCGCPHSVAQCLKYHPTCQHAKKAARLAAMAASSQMSGEEIALMLDKYYGSFQKRTQVKMDARMCQGPADAKVTVVEYSDFECPYCASARPILERFAKQNSQQVRFCYAPFPLSAHPHAILAGQVALLARDKGKFWAVHDLLFENQTRLNPSFIQELGTKAGLSASDVSKALGSAHYSDELNAWKQSGLAAGVEATPTLYFNGRKFQLPLTADALKQSLDDELEWMSHHNLWAPD